MILGIDPSTYFETLEAGARYYVDGKEVEPLSYLHDRNGVSVMRLRLWLDPFDEEGKPYGGGTVDYPMLLRLAKEGVAKGYKIMLDFHYSDFWCDPSKQFLPKAWRSLGFKEILSEVYRYTKKTLESLQNEGIYPDSIQIGNEITNGMLWPLAKLTSKGDDPSDPREGYENLIQVLRQGLKAAREVCPKSKLVIHLERSGDQRVYREFFDEVTKAKLDFDVIGISFYPYWHGTFQMVFDNVDALKERYHKPVWIVETSYGFTIAPGSNQDEDFKPLINEEFLSQDHVYAPYPITLEGQRDFTRELLRLAKEHGVGAVMWWEPLWLPLKGLCWATKEGEEYTHETEKPTNNEWANQCLFDYDGNATPALFEFKV